MSSLIWLGQLFPRQEPPFNDIWPIEILRKITDFDGSSPKAIIAKGNIICGIEAKT